MKPVFQTKFGEREGNCFAACLASLLETKIEAVPDFSPESVGRTWWQHTNVWLKRAHGLSLIMLLKPRAGSIVCPEDQFFIMGGPVRAGSSMR